ncbi:MAG: cysteine hydrolase family protein [Desulforhopalus sp.]
MNPALLIIDMQNDYFPGGEMELADIERVAGNIYGLLALFRSKGLPVIHVQHFSVGENASFFIPGTRGVEIHPSLTPGKDETLLAKNYPNAFRETELLKELRNRKIFELVICGAMTHMCIDTTVRAAFDLGLRSVVVADGCATRDLTFAGQTIKAVQVHGAFLAALASVFATVIPASEVKNRL